MDESDDMLLGRAVEGDRNALAALVQRHGAAVRSRLTRAMPTRWQSSFDLDDVMQQTYTDAILAIERFVPHGVASFTAWMTTLGRNNLLNAIRGLEADKRGGVRRRVEGGGGCGADADGDSYVDLLELIGGESRTASREVARREAREMLHAAIEALPAAYRGVVWLYDIEGRSIEAVASELGRSPGAVHMLRSRAHRMLAERLGTVSRFLSRGG